jgi:hypothetical protein
VLLVEMRTLLTLARFNVSLYLCQVTSDCDSVVQSAYPESRCRCKKHNEPASLRTCTFDLAVLFRKC